MSRPSISLACIMKNEASNISALLQSVKGCFDEIVFVDTGSTDNSVEFLEQINKQISEGQPMWAGMPEIKVHHFDWINDFAAARNYAFSKCTSDYIMWMDLDDSLSDAKSFINWRDNVLHSAHYWVATYNYAYNQAGQVECQFIRERVIRRDYGFKWQYFVHEGLLQVEGKKYWPQRVTSWTVNHRRTDDDRKADHGRNLRLFESHDMSKEAPRMLYYYGKELVEAGQPEKACQPLLDALKTNQLDLHDRIMATQFAAQSAFMSKAYDQAIDLAMNGLRLTVGRAELWSLLGDCYQSINQHGNALFAYKVATTCVQDGMGGMVVCYPHAYFEYPLTQIASVAMVSGDLEQSLAAIGKLEAAGINVSELRAKYDSFINLNTVREGLPKVDDVIITCPPGCAVTDWDENTLISKGHGGSETAAIEVSKWIALKTRRRVKIFHTRQRREVMPSGVEYNPLPALQGYLHNLEPKAHIMWRHSTPLTKAKSYIWCHDLQCPGAEHSQNYDKIVALSGFHKKYLIETNGVPEDKIVLGFNGINPDDFTMDAVKDPLKVVFSSSPDRGLVQTIDIVKKARELSKLDIKLHCFYGFENMRKAGQGAWADSIEHKISENDFVVMHGLVTKQVLMKHFKEAGVWLYPADFIETFCITAIEALCAGTWGIVRSMGALPYTLAEAIDKGMVDMLDPEVKDDASIGFWAEHLVSAISEKKWEKVKVNPADYSWEKVADFFIKEMEL